MAFMFKRQIFPSTKTIFGIVILMYFGSHVAFANRYISSCNKQLKQLKEDVKNWNERCIDDDYLERNTTRCKEEGRYNQARIRKHTSQCFYEGNSNS